MSTGELRGSGAPHKNRTLQLVRPGVRPDDASPSGADEGSASRARAAGAAIVQIGICPRYHALELADGCGNDLGETEQRLVLDALDRAERRTSGDGPGGPVHGTTQVEDLKQSVGVLSTYFAALGYRVEIQVTCASCEDTECVPGAAPHLSEYALGAFSS